MSMLHDALKRAQSLNEARNVIRVPKEPLVRRANAAALVVSVACLALTAAALWKERERSHRDYAALSAGLAELDRKHEDLISKIHTEEPYLDTRIQLELFEVETGLKALSARVDAMDKDKESVLASDVALKEQLKADMALISKRLHNVERDHSELADRIEAVKTETQKVVPAEQAAS